MNTVFAIDLGNKQTKLYDGKELYVMPSVLLPAKEVDSSFTIDGNGVEGAERFSVSNGEDYYWGQGILKYDKNQLVDSLNFDGRYSNEVFKQLAEFSLGKLGNGYDEARNGVMTVDVVIGLPSADFENEKIISQLKNQFVRQHLITVDKQPVTIKVEDLWVIPQSTGTIMNVFYGGIDFDNLTTMTKSQYEHLELLSDGVIGVVDIGGGTLLLDTLERGKLKTTERKQLEKGANSLYENIARVMAGSFNPDVHKIETLIRQGNSENGYAYKRSQNNIVDVTDTVMSEIKDWTTTIVRQIQSTFRNLSSMDELIVTGGGAEIIDRDLFAKNFDQTKVIFVNNPEVSNVQGFYVKGKQEQAKLANK